MSRLEEFKTAATSQLDKIPDVLFYSFAIGGIAAPLAQVGMWIIAQTFHLPLMLGIGVGLTLLASLVAGSLTESDRRLIIRTLPYLVPSEALTVGICLFYFGGIPLLSFTL